jgi:hypothetical protein
MNITKKGLILFGLALIMFLSSGQSVALAAPRPPSNQQDPALAYNTERDEYLLIWSDDRSNGGLDIYARRLFTNGLPKGGMYTTSGRFRIVGGAGNQDQPAIAYNEERDEFLVVWSDDRNPDTGRDIYAQRLFTNGLPKGGFFPIYVGPGNQTEPAIAYSSFRDEYLAVWSDDRDGRMDIYGRRLGTTGLATRGEEFLIATGEGNKQEPALAFTGEQYLVLWTDDGGENLDILGKRVFANGLPIGGPEGHEFGVAVGSGNDMAAAIPTQGGLLVWSGDANADVTGMDLFGNQLFPNGLPIGGDHGISAPEANQVSPTLAYNPERGEYLVVWSDDRNPNFDLFGLRVYANGLPNGRDFPVFTDN